MHIFVSLIRKTDIIPNVVLIYWTGSSRINPNLFGMEFILASWKWAPPKAPLQQRNKRKTPFPIVLRPIWDSESTPTEVCMEKVQKILTSFPLSPVLEEGGRFIPWMKEQLNKRWLLFLGPETPETLQRTVASLNENGSVQCPPILPHTSMPVYQCWTALSPGV